MHPHRIMPWSPLASPQDNALVGGMIIPLHPHRTAPDQGDDPLTFPRENALVEGLVAFASPQDDA
ncbi:hypothetical protein [Dictyobacter kobayashii]|uniref:Uncharacterized protein n=1 Tax=Dictyobacter kobayashii TaxID=2014872 RepID=A0A402AHI6_9CHLR|nr:hypothetical protein [Dictyobacter kobayashii]GCE18559.1 hypothetical protein KDK_23590 [Dictyobacter kobayashii]